jgi:hypothetical protein
MIAYPDDHFASALSGRPWRIALDDDTDARETDIGSRTQEQVDSENGCNPVLTYRKQSQAENAMTRIAARQRRREKAKP